MPGGSDCGSASSPKPGLAISGSPRCQWKLKQAAHKSAGCGRQELAAKTPEAVAPN